MQSCRFYLLPLMLLTYRLLSCAISGTNLVYWLLL
nr:MAG TPA: hypothetical protein [Caudoviricetes sp.]